MKLEELARKSSDAARISVSRLDPPSVGGAASHRPWMPLFAGVGVVALVVAGLAVLVRDRGADDTAGTVPPGVVEIPRLGLPDLEGWTVTYAGSFDDLGGGPAERTVITYYGDADADDPFAARDLLIAALGGTEAGIDPAGAPGDTSIELRGTTATVSSASDAGLPDDATSIEWFEAGVDGTATKIVVASRSLAVDELTNIAETLTIDPVTGAIAPADELGFDELTTASGTPFAAYRSSDDGYLVAYQNEAESDAIVISTTYGDVDQDATVLRWWNADVTATEIDGRPAYLASFSEMMADIGPVVTWSPIEGVVATLNHLGADDTLDHVALAASATEIDEATWTAYLEATRLREAGADEFDEIFGQGSGIVVDDEYSWVLGLQGNDLCFQIQVGQGSVGSCQDRAANASPEGIARTIDSGFGESIAHVVIAADPSVAQVVEVEGRYTVDRVDADGLAWFVAIGDTSVEPRFNVIVDGQVVDVLEAGVEATATTEPALDANPAAVEAGVAGMDVVLSGASDPSFSWWLGRMGTDLCLVTSATPPTAACRPPADITVFAPVAAPSGELTFVALRDTPRCTEAVEVDGAIVDFVARGGDESNTFDVWAMTGVSDGWSVRVEGGGGRSVVDLPGPDGTASWPAIRCGG